MTQIRFQPGLLNLERRLRLHPDRLFGLTDAGFDNTPCDEEGNQCGED
ncbi:MAG: hypothetical protein II632_00195 [Bacteroidales bacterium]|nr:hypothetical protein [Bacteroidales bacterium]